MVPERTSAAPSLAAERTFYSSDLFPGEGSSQQPCFPCGVCSCCTIGSVRVSPRASALSTVLTTGAFLLLIFLIGEKELRTYTIV